MNARIYFALIASARMRNANNAMPRCADALLAGDWPRAYAAICGAADQNEKHWQDVQGANLGALADVQVLRELEEEAEQSYARAQRGCRAGGDALRLMSARNAGWQALLRDRFAVARNCFISIIRDRASDAAQEIEARVGLAIVDHRLGRPHAAMQVLLQADRSVNEFPNTLLNELHPIWQSIVSLLLSDITLHSRIRRSSALSDHVFWQSAWLSAEQAPGAAHQCEATDGLDVLGNRTAAGEATEATEATEAASATDGVLVRRYRAYMRYLGELSDGGRANAGALSDLLDGLRSCGSPQVLMNLRLNAVLAALAGGQGDLALRLFDAIGARDVHHAARHSDLEWLYVSAKLAFQRGQIHQGISLYTSYSLQALFCLRSQIAPTRSLDPQADAAQMARGDDIATRLPAKYRKAYRYIIEHIAHSELTTREVAAQVNVTERALQMVFKRSLGMSPGALIRKLRLEGIRNELMDDARVMGSVLGTANRWGVTSRSALVKSYRKQFDESPSETING
ncbi:HTH-type transcriptional activator RhaR [Pandoraea iniqua]|uniref:helix-turn-helix transcriptional regulator n=1 Tax=Pandoraea iniqua TaxID=2508288 RepID=UPI00123F99B9|nr:helix-turn-helix transcriptional regulator [Pandoraea iniqua]VVE11109.1 HTH-type transcriptional activator RhaR [Pandoraea iniqua]